jgi:Domain of unknown function (DUF6265)
MMIALLAYGLAQATTAAPTEVDPTPSLPLWLAGCWMAQEVAGPRTEECWTVPRGAMMLASSHRFNGQRTLSFEHMRIERQSESLALIALPNGANPTRFALVLPTTGSGAASVTFENLENSYPQRITYAQVDGGAILATISMADGRRAISWTFRRSGQATPPPPANAAQQ